MGSRSPPARARFCPAYNLPTCETTGLSTPLPPLLSASPLRHHHHALLFLCLTKACINVMEALGIEWDISVGLLLLSLYRGEGIELTGSDSSWHSRQSMSFWFSTLMPLYTSQISWKVGHCCNTRNRISHMQSRRVQRMQKSTDLISCALNIILR